MRKIASMAMAIAVAASLTAFAGTAEAKEVTVATPSVSLPYVDDVNPWGGGYIATVTCAGSAKAELKVTLNGKRVKVRKHAPRVWTVKLKKSRTYKLSVRIKGCAWKSIGYRIY